MDDTLDAAVPVGTAAERYARLEPLAKGGMGQIEQVKDGVLGRSVARKVMLGKLAENPENVRQFLREARVQGRLEHPAVLPVYDLGLDPNGLPWFTMKQVRGLDLHAVLEGLAQGDAELTARFPRRRLLTAFVQVCRAIDYAHSRSVVHRDLKPANIMLGEFGDVHVLDWGLAQVDREATGAFVGTPGYMAPEQVQRKPVDERTDVFALGAILFELLVLEPMFPGSTAEERCARTVGEEIGGPEARAPGADVPPELDAAVLAATRRDPSKRTPTARALAEAVERYLDGDRDLALRRALAVRHLDTARPLVEALDTVSTTQRETAMLEVNSALALDPGNALGLELLRRILTHMPAVLPPEVEAAQQQSEAQAYAGVARTVSLRTAMWLALLPLVWSMGPMDPRMAAGAVTAIVTAFAITWALGRRRELSLGGITLVLAASALPLITVSFVFGAFMLVPALASTGMVLATSHLRPRARGPVIVVGVLVVLVPFVLGELGLLQPAYLFIDDRVLIVPRLVHFPPGLSKVFLVAATITTLALPSVLAGQIRDRLALAEKRLFLTAWHLDRLGKQAKSADQIVQAPKPRLPAQATPTALDTRG